MITKIATLLNVSDSKEDKMYKSAIKLFKFSEVNGINLGFSESEHGAGFGENIGSDRLSDMVATIIYPDIVKFTKRIQDELGINKEKYSEFIFREDGLVVNPYKGCEILFLPKDILHELPIAKCWDDIDRVVSENENIRRKINEAVGEEWSR